MQRPGQVRAEERDDGGVAPAGREGLPARDVFDYALITRLVPPDLHKEVVPVNLREIVLESKPGADVALMPRDTLKVFHRRDFIDLPKASISGEVRLTRAELLKTLGLDNQAAIGRTTAEAGGRRPRGRSEERRSRGLGFQREAGAPARSGPGAGWSSGGPIREARIPARRNSARRKPAARISAPADVLTFEIHGGTRVADLVKMAGGLTRMAYLERAEIVRVDDNRNYRTIYFHLGKAMAGDPEENKLLENEDQVRIHSVLETAYRKTVPSPGR